MKDKIKQWVRAMMAWPIVGPLARLAVTLSRLPTVLRTLSDSNRRQRTFEEQQLPALLQALSDINHRLVVGQRNVENLTQSVPLTLRALARDIHRLKTQHLPSTNPPRVLDASKVEAARSSVVNLLWSDSLGDDPCDVPEAWRSYLRISGQAGPGVDIVADLTDPLALRDLPFTPGSVQAVVLLGGLGRCTHAQLRDHLLPYWTSLLVAGGTLTVRAPDARMAMQRYLTGELSDADLRQVLYGDQNHGQASHQNLFTADGLTELFQQAGFRDIRVTTLAHGDTNQDEPAALEVSAQKVTPHKAHEPSA